MKTEDVLATLKSRKREGRKNRKYDRNRKKASRRFGKVYFSVPVGGKCGCETCSKKG